MTPDDRIFLKRFFQSLSDQPLDPSDKPYVPLYEEPGLADEDPVKLLADGIEWTSESVQLLSGYRGTGKSTELRRLKARLEESGYLVFLCDVEGYPASCRKNRPIHAFTARNTGFSDRSSV